MEKQVDKFARLCFEFNILVYDVGFDSVNVRKGDFEMNVGKWLLSNDYHLLRTMLKVYSSFREFEQRKLRENNEKN